ncbi:conserved hypothetical protein [Frankia sp. Hr75.2]|uniref:hypothetical protein n=1 Tax=Frankia sp. Mgl5 TaxID=2933793 RepID=UPI00200CC0A1|nr:hypothetical protein [Frankia sp. Mgl5]CAI7979629.1 conserved hypothetical protein [Frankia sp. Hr75.2]
MVYVVNIAAPIDEIPTMEETDAMLNKLCQLPRTTDTTTMIDDLLEFRSLLDATR